MTRLVSESAVAVMRKRTTIKGIPTRIPRLKGENMKKIIEVQVNSDDPELL